MRPTERCLFVADWRNLGELWIYNMCDQSWHKTGEKFHMLPQSEETAKLLSSNPVTSLCPSWYHKKMSHLTSFCTPPPFFIFLFFLYFPFYVPVCFSLIFLFVYHSWTMYWGRQVLPQYCYQQLQKPWKLSKVPSECIQSVSSISKPKHWCSLPFLVCFFSIAVSAFLICTHGVSFLK